MQLTDDRLLGRTEEHGSIALLTATLAIVLFTVAAIVVDLSHAREVRRQAQNAADAAALAGMNAMYADGVPNTQAAVDAVKAYARDNDFGAADTVWAACIDVETPAGYATAAASGSSPCITVNADKTRLRVLLPTQQMPTRMAGIIGVDQIAISAAAEATAGSTGSPACGLCVLGPSTHSFSGNGSVETENAGMYFNGDVAASGNAELTADGGTISIEGGYSRSGNAAAMPTPRTNQPTLRDPLAYVPMPFATTGSMFFGKKSFSGNDTDCVLEPGRYTSITLSGNSACVMKPGLYAITGSLSVSGNGSIDATSGVTLYFPCGSNGVPEPCASTGESGGVLSLSGNAPLRINAPTAGPYQGLSIVADRHNTATLSYSGNTSKTITGTVYAASAQLKVSGNANQTLDSMLVVKDLSYSGNGSLVLRWEEEKNIPLAGGNLHLSY